MPTVTEWYTYRSPSGVSIEYPAFWQVYTIGTPDSVAFRLDAAKEISIFYWINIDIYNRPIQDRDTADPHTWYPNEGGYEILWERPIIIDNLPGVEFAWGTYKNDERRWRNMPTLMAILYSEQYQLDIRLTAGFNEETADLALVEGFDKVIGEKFTVFEYMLQSIRIEPSIAVGPYPAPVGCTPIPCPTATVAPAPTTPPLLNTIEINHHSLQSILEAVKYAFASGDVRVFENLAAETVRFSLAFSDGPGQVLSKQEFIEMLSLRLPSRPACYSYETWFGEIDALNISTIGWEPLWKLGDDLDSTHLLLTFSDQDTGGKGLFLKSILVPRQYAPIEFGLPCE